MAILKTISFDALTNWSVKYLLKADFSYNEKYNLVPIGNFLTRNKTPIDVKDEEEYKRVTIKINNKGVLLRNIDFGKNIGTKKQFIVNEGQFLLSKIDARNGAFGVIPSNLSNAIITGNFWTYDVDYSTINPYFLSLIVTTKEFINFCQNASNGTTNRHYLQEDLFLAQPIPLPKLEEQNRILSNYNQKTKLANQQQKEAKQLEQEIENYLFEVLGIKKLEQKETKKGLQFVRFEEISRWDVLAEDMRTINNLAKSTYQLQKIGDVYNFDKRSWNKRNYSEQTFNYIELGAINPNFGIKEIKEVKINEAPSRATQQVKTGDLIIGTTRPYLKRFTIIEEKYNDYICSSGFSIITPSSNYNLFFLKEFITSYYGIEQLKNRMTGATYPAITNDELKEILIPLPPLEIQNEIVEHISTLKNKIKDLRTQSAHNKALALEEFENELFN